MATQWFVQQLKNALSSLYDPTLLRSSPLAELLAAAQLSDPAALRSTLLQSIETLRPTPNTPHDSRAWRVYQILRRRYTEGLSQRQVAADLGLGVRQLQREEKLARELLAEHLWNFYSLASKVLPDAPVESEEEQEPADEAAADALQEELAWLQNSVFTQLTDLRDLIQDVLATVEPLMQKSDVTVALTLVAAQRVPLRAAILRQALLDIISTAVPCARGGQIQLQAQSSPPYVYIQLHALGGHAGAEQLAAAVESLAMAEQLIRLCGGSLQVSTAADPAEPVLRAIIVIQAPEQVPVLVIDDNADALQLFQRYLAGSRYLFVGAHDARYGLEVATELCPRAILLDVILAEQDGWSLLRQLREQPQTSTIPVIICTLLSQRELALALGAAGFLHKPVTRAYLLAALDRLLAPPPDRP